MMNSSSLARSLVTASLPLLAGAILLAAPLSAHALAMVDFVSSGGQFSIANNTLSFGNGLTISSARDNSDVADAALLQATVLIDDIALTGEVISIGDPADGVFAVGIDTDPTYTMRIFTPPGPGEEGGDLLFSADFDPGRFIVVGTGGNLSPDSGADLFGQEITTLGLNSAALVALAGSDPVDLNIVLSAAGQQNLASRIENGQLILGSAAGSLAVIPEPSTVVLMSLGLGGLAMAGRRSRRRG